MADVVLLMVVLPFAAVWLWGIYRESVGAKQRRALKRQRRWEAWLDKPVAQLEEPTDWAKFERVIERVLEEGKGEPQTGLILKNLPWYLDDGRWCSHDRWRGFTKREDGVGFWTCEGCGVEAPGQGPGGMNAPYGLPPGPVPQAKLTQALTIAKEQSKPCNQCGKTGLFLSAGRCSPCEIINKEREAEERRRRLRNPPYGCPHRDHERILAYGSPDVVYYCHDCGLSWRSPVTDHHLIGLDVSRFGPANRMPKL